MNKRYDRTTSILCGGPLKENSLENIENRGNVGRERITRYNIDNLHVVGLIKLLHSSVFFVAVGLSGLCTSNPLRETGFLSGGEHNFCLFATALRGYPSVHHDGLLHYRRFIFWNKARVQRIGVAAVVVLQPTG